MLRLDSTRFRKYVLTCLLAVSVGGLGMGTDVFAGKNKNGPNPSDTGAANGVAHRVAALEAAVANTQDALLLAIEQITVLEEDVTLLEGDVSALEARVAALEAAATAP